MIARVDKTLEKVDPTRNPTMRTYEKRLGDFERAYFDGYGAHVGAINLLAESILYGGNKVFKQGLANIMRSAAYLDAAYGEIDFQTLPRNGDTRHYFKARMIYDQLRREISGLESKRNPNPKEIVPSLKKIKYLSSLLGVLGREPRNKIEREVLRPLNSIDGFPGRSLKRRVPKAYRDSQGKQEVV